MELVLRGWVYRCQIRVDRVSYRACRNWAFVV